MTEAQEATQRTESRGNYEALIGVAAVVFWILVFVFAPGCGTVPTPTPTPTPVPDVTDYSAVCQHLAELGCAEGAAPECAVALGRFQDGRMVDFDVQCLARAQTAAAARACGSVLCE